MRHRDRYEQRLRDQIATHGWSVIAVAPASEKGTSWAYTVGLIETFAHPELPLVGFWRDRAHGLLNSAAGLIRDGKRLAPGTRVADVLERDDLTCGLRTVPPGLYPTLFGRTSARYGSGLEVLQLFLPDAENRMPWEPGADDDWFRQYRQVDLQALAAHVDVGQSNEIFTALDQDPGTHFLLQ